jgi:hypothetical protein
VVGRELTGAVARAGGVVAQGGQRQRPADSPRPGVGVEAVADGLRAPGGVGPGGALEVLVGDQLGELQPGIQLLGGGVVGELRRAGRSRCGGVGKPAVSAAVRQEPCSLPD